MTDSKYRIPRMAAAALVLGGGCADDHKSGGSGSSAGSDVSAARIGKMAGMYCSQYMECDPEGFANSYDDKADCVRTYSGDFRSYVSVYGEVCADALFDLIECNFSPACDTDPRATDEKCVALETKAKGLCPDGIFDDSSDASQSAGKSLAAKPARRSLRIPR